MSRASEFLRRPGSITRLEMLRDQCEVVFLCGLAQLLVPTGEIEFLASREGKRSAQVDCVVGAQ